LPSKVQPPPSLLLIVHAGDKFGSLAEQIKAFRTSYSDARIAIVADWYRPDELVGAFRAGASGYFVGGITCDIFIRSLELLMIGETVLPTNFLPYVFGPEEAPTGEHAPAERNEAIVLNDEIAPHLSSRERLILRCLIEGDSNKSIARKIGIAEATVKVHVKAILRKIRVHNRTQAAIWGMNNGWNSRVLVSIPPSLAPEAEPVSNAKAVISQTSQDRRPMLNGARPSKAR
jgi:two-component system nitrate/nitrite response regulator NarL